MKEKIKLKKETHPNDAHLGEDTKKKCDWFYTYDDYMDDQERTCVNCGQPENKHYQRGKR